MSDDYPYLVTGVVRKAYYLEKPVETTETRIVMAENAEWAESKFRSHFENQSVAQYVNYFIVDVDVHAPIW